MATSGQKNIGAVDGRRDGATGGEESGLNGRGHLFPALNSLGFPVFDTNGNMPVSDAERAQMVELAQQKFAELFDILRIDRNDPNAADTPRRLAKMWVMELFRGRYEPPPALTVFPNRKHVDELVISANNTVMSVCSHHWQTISGACTVGYLPGDKVIGLSKISRIVDWFSRRGQIQEELGEQIADYIEDLIQPKALGVVIKSRHYCMIARGVSEDGDKSVMITSVMRGLLGTDFNLRNEFLKLIA